jgi:hypothetical protein
MDEKENPRSKQYDHSWDEDDFDEDDDFDETEEELDEEEEAPLERKMERWDQRNWEEWLEQYVTFP